MVAVEGPAAEETLAGTSTSVDSIPCAVICSLLSTNRYIIILLNFRALHVPPRQVMRLAYDKPENLTVATTVRLTQYLYKVICVQTGNACHHRGVRYSWIL